MHAFRHQTLAVHAAAAELRDRSARGEPLAVALSARLAAFTAASPWLTHDARFEAFAVLHGTDDYRLWPARDRAPNVARIAEVERENAHAVFAWAFGQYVLHVQHQLLRAHLGALGMKLYGDMQIGLSLRDRWSRQHLFLERYLMGAPPSRTNPEGQPWGYPVLDPRQLRDPGSEALGFFRVRVEKLFSELDGVRIDHPHGLVCPWVYDGAAPDPMDAVRRGARLYETPISLEHPSLTPFAKVRPEQIDPSVPAYDDDHVLGLTPAQTDEYVALVEIVMSAARATGRTADEVLCEVLSTCPAPLARVMERYALGRFRVTQKASLTDPEDGYRGENAARGDWTMLGNHDTPPLRAVIERWTREATIPARAEYLATRLEPDASRRTAFAASVAGDPRRLALAMFAELFVGPASNVLVFHADLYGERDTYNTPGLVSDVNWSMRVPGAFREVYMDRRARAEALDIPGALALALRARGEAFVQQHAGLVAALEACAALGR